MRKPTGEISANNDKEIPKIPKMPLKAKIAIGMAGAIGIGALGVYYNGEHKTESQSPTPYETIDEDPLHGPNSKNDGLTVDHEQNTIEIADNAAETYQIPAQEMTVETQLKTAGDVSYFVAGYAQASLANQESGASRIDDYTWSNMTDGVERPRTGMISFNPDTDTASFVVNTFDTEDLHQVSSVAIDFVVNDNQPIASMNRPLGMSDFAALLKDADSLTPRRIIYTSDNSSYRANITDNGIEIEYQTVEADGNIIAGVVSSADEGSSQVVSSLGQDVIASLR